MIFYAFIIILEIATVDATVDCIEVRTQEKGFIRLTVEFDATKQGYTSNITTVDQILRRVFILTPQRQSSERNLPGTIVP